MSWDHWDHLDDYEPPMRSGLAREERFEHGWCSTCGMFLVDAYFCIECALHSGYVRRDDTPAATGTSIGRALQRRVDAAMAYEQMQQLWSITEANANPVDPDEEERQRSVRLRILRAANAPSYFKGAKVPGPRFEFNPSNLYRGNR